MKKTPHVEELKSKKAAAAEEKNSNLFHLSAQVGRGTDGASAGYRHVAWINVYSLPSGDRMPRIVGIFECETLKASFRESDQDRANTFPEVLCFIFPEPPGTLHTASFTAALRLWGTLED